MARGSTLSKLRTMLKAECGYNMQVGVATAQDTELNQLLNNMQQWLWSQHQWPFLYTYEDIAIVAGQRFYAYPTVVSLDYPTEVESYWGTLWYPVDYGIKGEQYDAIDPSRGETQDPISRWQIDATQGKFEVWPPPSGGQTLRFRGTAIAPQMVADGSLAVLDDLLIVLFAAGEKLARANQKDSQAKIQKATLLFHQLRGANQPDTCMVIGGGPESSKLSDRRGQRIVTVIGNPNH